ncbi:MAG: hypothetical protein AAGI48_04110 [Verrucomicrobiota bacterium]
MNFAKAFGVLLSFVMVSCVPGTYTRDFVKETASQPDPPTSVEGPWVGEWKSEVNGHQGPLWCIVRPSEDQPGHYDFRYRAGWGMMKFGDYVHQVAAEPDAEGNLELKGEMDLPAGLGVYEVDGRLTPTEFKARFDSKGDRGTMLLKRP